ncbi:MAG: PA14 domain-containing protein [Burkholderiaceae bacterium]|nr:PA14 domain-containing protein [Burkholderiaceae bacterium]
MAVGASATIAVAATGSGPLTYQWLRNGALLPSATSPVLHWASAQSGDAGAYEVIIGNTAGSVRSATAVLNVASPSAPTISVQPQSLTVASGTAATMAVAAAGTGPLTYQWLRDGVAIPGAISSVLTWGSAQPADVATYEAIVTNGAGSVRSTAAALNVTTTAAPVVAVPPADQHVYVALWPFATLFTAIEGVGPITYQWTRNGANLPGATQPSLQVDCRDPANARAAFRLRVSNPAGTTLSPPAVSYCYDGLTGSYFLDYPFDTLHAQRRDVTIDFDWGSGSPMPSLRTDYFGARWDGWLTAPVDGNYVIETEVDDGVRLWIDGVLVIDQWGTRPRTVFNTSVALQAGRRYAIRLEYYEEGGEAVMILRWTPPGGVRTTFLPLSTQ